MTKWMHEDDGKLGPGYRAPETTKTWRRKDGSLVRRPEPETLRISLTRDQSRALKALAETEGVKPFELAQRAVSEFIRGRTFAAPRAEGTGPVRHSSPLEIGILDL